MQADLILDNLEELFVLVDTDLNVQYFNKKVLEFFPKISKSINLVEIFQNSTIDEVTRLFSYIHNIKYQNMTFIFKLEGMYFNINFKELSNYYLLEFKLFENCYFMNIINRSNISLVLVSPEDEKVIFASDHFATSTGYSKEEILGKNLSFLKYDDSDMDKRKKIRKAINEKKPIETILKNAKKSGEVFYNKISISPIINNETGRLQFFLGINQDVTKEILSKLYYQAILDISKSIIIVTDGKVLKNVNKVFFEITGFKDLDNFREKHSSISELFVAKEPHYIMPITDGVSWTEYLKNNPLNYKTKRINKVCILDKDGNERIFQIETSGKIVGQEEEVITLTEITILLKNRKLLEEQTKHAAMGEMIAMIAHQWRQPLTTLGTIYSKINLLHKMKILKDEDFESAYEKSKNIIEHLSETINDFRNFFHKDEIIEKIQVAKLIKKSSGLLETSFRVHSIDFQVQYIENADKMFLNVNGSKLTQVLLNLLKNAFDELQKKGRKDKKIHVMCYLDEKYFNINILDNAGGVPSDIIDKIFEPYFSTKSKNGTGLGLYMSKIIIEDHLKGKLTVRNKHEGASFNIKLPKELIGTDDV